jgi:hypothetical protein
MRTLKFPNTTRTISIKDGMRVCVARAIVRREGPYASKGDSGIVREVFKSGSSSARGRSLWYAKVQMDGGGIKTFRITSLVTPETL